MITADIAVHEPWDAVAAGVLAHARANELMEIPDPIPPPPECLTAFFLSVSSQAMANWLGGSCAIGAPLAEAHANDSQR